MTTSGRRLIRPIAVVAALALLLATGMVYPFLPGRYDHLAVALSTMVQLFGVAGLALVPVGILWLKFPARRFLLAVVSLVVLSAVALVLVVSAAATAGYAFAVLVLSACAGLLASTVPKLRRLGPIDDPRSDLVPLCLIWLPVTTFVVQLAVAVPMTEWSRGRAMANADALIADLEEYPNRYGRYPEAIEALHADYDPGVVGVERYFYSPQGTTYNLAFEQPRFLLDRIGTRERVVYNPRDEHRAYGHTEDLLEAPEAVGPSQGWYAAGDAGRPHWMYFLFD